MTASVVTLVMPAKSEYLILARLALAGIAREVPMSEAVLADLKLAVTEACGNAVRHAYGDGHGVVRVRFVVDAGLDRDRGRGRGHRAGRRPAQPVAASGRRRCSRAAWASRSSARSSTSSRSTARADAPGTVVRMRKSLASDWAWRSPSGLELPSAASRVARIVEHLVEPGDLEDPPRRRLGQDDRAARRPPRGPAGVRRSSFRARSSRGTRRPSGRGRDAVAPRRAPPRARWRTVLAAEARRARPALRAVSPPRSGLPPRS